MTRHVFYSFNYKPDVFRVSQVRNIGALEANRPAHDNDWETVVGGGDRAIERWIADQMKGRSCTIVLVGSHTAGRKWITHEIVKSWNDGMGVAGVRINGLQNRLKQTSQNGGNPFGYVDHNKTGLKLSSIVKLYSPEGNHSKARYAWIAKYLEAIVEEAIRIRKAN